MAQIFLGHELMKVDAKGRVGIPSRFVSVLRSICPDQAESVGIMLTPEQSLRIVPLPVFIEDVERWDKLNNMNAAERLLKTIGAGSSEMAALDKQNRIKLSPLMMEMCDIKQMGQVVFVGAMDCMQVFEVGVWKELFKSGMGRLSAAMEQVSEKDKPKPRENIRQIVINMADLEARARETAPEDADS